jgi:imidazolonepropionase-like amidohydrolase
VDTAHAAGRKVAIHSYGPAGARDAIRAGTDTLEHATDMDDATIAELARSKIWYIPTINHNQHYLDHADDVYKFSAEAKNNLRNFIQRNFVTAQKAYRAGARMLVGSDAVYTAFGTNMQELSWFVKFGMSNEQALQSQPCCRPKCWVWKRRWARLRPATRPTSSRWKAIRSRMFKPW